MSAASSNGGRPPRRPNYNPMNSVSNATDMLITQAQTLMDDLETGVQGDLRRCRTFYRLHFPELEKIVRDRLLYARVVQRIGRRTNLPNVDLSDLLTAEEIEKVVEAGRNSCGVDMSENDIEEIFYLCDHVIMQGYHRASLEDLLEERMPIIAPNLTAYLGPKLGAKLIVQVGSLVNLTRKTLSARRRGQLRAREEQEARARAVAESDASGSTETNEDETDQSGENGEGTSEDLETTTESEDKSDEPSDDASISTQDAEETPQEFEDVTDEDTDATEISTEGDEGSFNDSQSNPKEAVRGRRRTATYTRSSVHLKGGRQTSWSPRRRRYNFNAKRVSRALRVLLDIIKGVLSLSVDVMWLSMLMSMISVHIQNINEARRNEL